MNNFWQNLPKPFTALAPLDGVTDVVFRQVITEVGKPDVLFTEFTSCEGFCSGGRKRILKRFQFTPEQKPIVAQIWGLKPELFYETASFLRNEGFAGIDINMGCPQRDVVKHGACSAMINNHALAKEIIQATQEGAGDIPVSVKTRIGFSHEQIDEWLRFVLEQKLAALTVHLRTVSELSQVPAHWDLMPQVIALRNEIAPQTIIMGNGDLTSLDEINDTYATYGCDGFMVGRGIFANPWLFNREINPDKMTPTQRIDLYLRHIDLFEKTWEQRNFGVLKKFCKTYIQNFPDVASFRESLMETQSLPELREKLLAYKQDLL